MRGTDFNDWYIELFEDFQTERKGQLNKREGEIIREIGTLNKNIAGRTNKESKKEYEKKIKIKKNMIKNIIKKMKIKERIL